MQTERNKMFTESKLFALGIGSSLCWEQKERKMKIIVFSRSLLICQVNFNKKKMIRGRHMKYDKKDSLGVEIYSRRLANRNWIISMVILFLINGCWQNVIFHIIIHLQNIMKQELMNLDF